MIIFLRINDKPVKAWANPHKTIVQYKPSMKEDQLIAKLRQGSDSAVREWYATFEPKLQRFVLSKISNTRDAEEIVQDTFISCLESLPLFTRKSSLWTWMCSVANHETADYFRKKYAKRMLHAIPFVDALLPTQLHDMHVISGLVKSVLSRMPLKHREVLLMKYVDGFDVKVIATRLKVSFKSAESLLFRARQQFRVLYMEQDGK